MSITPALHQKFTPEYFDRKVEKYEQKINAISPQEKSKKAPETVAKSILDAVFGGGAVLFDRSLQAIAVPGSYLVLQGLHRGFEFAAACVDVGFSAKDKVDFERWTDRTRALKQKEVPKQLESYQTEKVEAQFKEWSHTVLEEEALSSDKKIEMFRDKGIAIEKITQKKGAEALDAFKRVLENDTPEYQQVFKTYKDRLETNDTLDKCLFQPVRELINHKQEQLRPLFNWGLIRSFIRLGWGGTLSAVLVGMQIATVAAGILFPPGAVAALVGGIILGLIGMVVASICISAKKMPNSYRLHFNGLTTKLALDKIKRGFLKARHHFKIRKLTHSSVEAGKKLTHFNRLASNLAKAHTSEADLSKRTELETMLTQVSTKISESKKAWKQDSEALETVLQKTQKYDAAINRREKAFRHAQMADYMLQVMPDKGYHKAPVSKKEVQALINALDPQTKQAASKELLQKETVEIRDLIPLIALGNLSLPVVQEFLKKHVIKNQEGEITLEHLLRFQQQAKDPLKLKALVKEIVRHDPDLKGAHAHQLLEIGLNLDSEAFRKTATIEAKEKMLTQALKKFLCFNKDAMQEHYRTQGKKK